MKFKIPLFDLNFDEAEEKALIETIRSKWISTGPKTEEFENLFSSMIGVKYSIAVANCTAALHLAMVLCGIKEGDEVICPSLTFVATANSIRYANAIPIFADIKSLEDLTIDPEDIKRKINSKTKAIIVMHYGGFACNMDEIINIAKNNGLKIVEDASHSPLSEYKGRKLGSMGDIGCFSFFSNKNISTAEGGMLVTNNIKYFEKAKLLRSHGMSSTSFDRSKGHSTDYDVVETGYNYRMDDLRASVGIVQLKKLRKDIDKRIFLRKLYLDNMLDINEIIMPFKYYNGYSSNYIFPIVLKNSNVVKRDKIRIKLAEAGIQTSIHYPAVHLFSIYKDRYFKLPKTEYISDNLITLPMYSSLEEKNNKLITDTLRNLLK